MTLVLPPLSSDPIISSALGVFTQVLTPFDTTALGIFLVAWLGYEPLLRHLSHRAWAGTITTHMSVVRRQWMRNLLNRQVKLFDSQLIGHTLHSASYFASASLLLIAAVAGALFSGTAVLSGVHTLGAKISSLLEIKIKLALITVCLVRGFLDFTWAIRQMNYCVGGMGSIPEQATKQEQSEFATALTQMLDPALSSMNQGVRGYYFALAAGAWLFGPLSFLMATLAFTALMIWRQVHSRQARGIEQLRALIDIHEARKESEPDHENAAPQQMEPDAAILGGSQKTMTTNGL